MYWRHNRCVTQTAQAVLTKPSVAYRESFLEAMGEFTEADFQAMVIERRMATSDFEGYVRSVDAWSRGEELLAGWVAVTTFWMVEGNTYIGSVNIRHELNDYLLRWGGHIGYAIRPALRRVGYGTEICRLALIESRRMGFDQVHHLRQRQRGLAADHREQRRCVGGRRPPARPKRAQAPLLGADAELVQLDNAVSDSPLVFDVLGRMASVHVAQEAHDVVSE
jgi:predicted acetyltransferase